MNKEFGDFQTPPPLVSAVLERLYASGKSWSRVIEPTCGRGNFIEGLLKLSSPPCEIQAIELQEEHYENTRRWEGYSCSTRVNIRQGNVFHLSLHRDLKWSETGPLLVVGNPPWVTNAELGALESDNLPYKKNIKGIRGIEARTGEANFDIAEYIWLKLMRELASEHPTIALLCKTSVARNVLQFAFDHSLPVTAASMRIIDAKKWFGAAVEACLFTVEIGPGERRYEAAVYQHLQATEPAYVTGIVGRRLVTNVETYTQVVAVDGRCPLTWRQGLKHDAASVMELTVDNAKVLKNKLGEIVDVEPEYLYPLLKSSDLFHSIRPHQQKAVIVTQNKLGENTYNLKLLAPRLWSYLTKHTELFEQRKSSIYDGQAPFAIFGIGDYSFAPYKVAISGFHKIPKFRVIGPIDGRPVMLDDTCYFIPCHTLMEAAFLASFLNDPLCLELINSIVFLDAKRPITKKLLQRIDLRALFQLIDKEALLLRVDNELVQLEAALQQNNISLPSSMEEFLDAYFQKTTYTGATRNKSCTDSHLMQDVLFPDVATSNSLFSR